MLSRCLALGLFFLVSVAYADSRLIIHLTDYLANDYAGAVSEEGKVLSDGEYAEQVEFSQTALKEGQSDEKVKQDAALVKKLVTLNDHIAKKSPPSVVVPLAREIQKLTIQVSGIALAPSSWPDYERAKNIFAEKCVSCHGAEGRGDGPDGADLDPRPANFHDLERAPIVSPFAAFNTIRLGVPGTGMVSFSDLSDDEIWSLAFYVSSLRFGAVVKSREALSKLVSNDELLGKAAALNDEQLRTFLLEKGESTDLVAKIRSYHFESSSDDYLNKAQALLVGSLEAAKAGDHKRAEAQSLEAYFTGIEPIETKIIANDPGAVTRLEENMGAYRLALKNADLVAAESILDKLLGELGALRALLSGKEVTPTFAFASGFSIILREGFEAVLVILAILGVGKAAGSSLVTTAIHAGWVTSLGLGIIGWFLSGWLIGLSGASREVMEAVAAFFAVFVLLYVGFWMHRQTEISRWKEFISVKVKNLAQTKNLVGLFLLAFVVTFREVIETILFLRTIALDTPEGVKAYILAGVVVAFGVVLTVSVLVSKYRNKISLQKFFNLSSMIMLGLATILAGKGIHALHEAGLFPMTPFPLKLRVELLGIFPTWQTLMVQVVVFAASVLIWKRASKKT